MKNLLTCGSDGSTLSQEDIVLPEDRMEQKVKDTRLNIRVNPHWRDRLSIAAKLANIDTSDFVRLSIDEKIDRMKIEKPGFAEALAAALRIPPEQRRYTVDLQSVN